MGNAKTVANLEKPHPTHVMRIARMVWRGYTYLYYRLYAWNLKMWGESDLPQWNALFGVSFLATCNLVTLIAPFDFILHTHMVFNTSYWPVLLILGACVYITYVALIREGRYRKLGNEFRDFDPRLRRRYTLFCWLYGLGSIALPFSVGALIHLFA